MRALYVVLLLSLLHASAVRAQEFEFERVLLPIFTQQTEGAYGSRFASSLFMHNSSSEPVHVQPFDDGCRVTTCTPARIAPHTTLQPLVGHNPPGGNPARYVFIEKAFADEVTYNLRIQDVSRQSLTWGTEIPVLRERDFSARAISLFPVPLDERFRQALRIYDLDEQSGSTFRVRIYRVVPRSDGTADPLAALINTVVVSTPPQKYPQPGIAQLISLRDAFPSLASESLVRIDIESEDGSPFWAMVSVTNNETQHITLITPQ